MILGEWPHSHQSVTSNSYTVFCSGIEARDYVQLCWRIRYVDNCVIFYVAWPILHYPTHDARSSIRRESSLIEAQCMEKTRRREVECDWTAQQYVMTLHVLTPYIHSRTSSENDNAVKFVMIGAAAGRHNKQMYNNYHDSLIIYKTQTALTLYKCTSVESG